MPFSSSVSGSARILLLGAHSLDPVLLSVLRSLNCEHIALGSTDSVPDLGVPRNILAPSQPRRAALDALRRWFFRRKPASGFLLTGFPVSLQEAAVFDSWLDESGETIDVCLFPPVATDAGELLRAHYAVQGLAWTPASGALLPEWIQPVTAP